MLHKVLILYLCLLTAAKAGAFGYLFATQSLYLPVPVLAAVGLLLVLTVALLLREKRHTARRREYIIFFGLYILITLFALFYTAWASPLRVTFAETVLTGSFTDIIIAIAWMGILLRRRNYVRIHSEKSPEKDVESKTNV